MSNKYSRVVVRRYDVDANGDGALFVNGRRKVVTQRGNGVNIAGGRIGKVRARKVRVVRPKRESRSATTIVQEGDGINIAATHVERVETEDSADEDRVRVTRFLRFDNAKGHDRSDEDGAHESDIETSLGVFCPSDQVYYTREGKRLGMPVFGPINECDD